MFFMDCVNWKNYFELNRPHFSDIDWAMEEQLTNQEMKIITPSIQQFQKGENSEGKHFFALAKTFPDPLYLDCIKLFIAEEQKHALVLGKFMDNHGIQKIRRHWVDGCFRWLRKFSGLENSVTVLVTAEIIAKVYYNALMTCTKSKLLRRLCLQILKDEDQHIIFQCYTLSYFYSRKNLMMKSFARGFHFGLMVGTTFIVWIYHHRVLKTGGYNFNRFFIETISIFFEAEEIVRNEKVLTQKFLVPVI
jgi:hypothetical protein